MLKKKVSLLIYLQSFTDISEVDNVIEKAKVLKQRELYKV